MRFDWTCGQFESLCLGNPGTLIRGFRLRFYTQIEAHIRKTKEVQVSFMAQLFGNVLESPFLILSVCTSHHSYVAFMKWTYYILEVHMYW